MQVERYVLFIDAGSTMLTQYAKNLSTALEQELAYALRRNQEIERIELKEVKGYYYVV